MKQIYLTFAFIVALSCSFSAIAQEKTSNSPEVVKIQQNSNMSPFDKKVVQMDEAFLKKDLNLLNELRAQLLVEMMDAVHENEAEVNDARRSLGLTKSASVDAFEKLDYYDLNTNQLLLFHDIRQREIIKSLESFNFTFDQEKAQELSNCRKMVYEFQGMMKYDPSSSTKAVQETRM